MTIEGGKKMKSIIFSGEMVKAILDGRKTQTRRVVRFDRPPPEKKYELIKNDGGELVLKNPKSGNEWKAKAGYGVDDIVYVKETWAEHQEYYNNGEPVFKHPHYIYKADGVFADNWRSPMFMPKKATRLHIRITDVKAERLHDIVKDGIHVQDIRREGIIVPCSVCETLPGHYNGNCRKIMAKNECGMINSYANLWDSSNAKDGYRWSFNPWVWVYTFKKIEKE